MSYPTSDAEQWIDLADDCREVSGVLAPYVVDLTVLPTSIPAPRPHTIDLTNDLAAAAASLDGYADYGS